MDLPAEAAAVLRLTLRTVLSRTASGKLPTRIPDDMPFTYDGRQNYLIRLKSLPQKAQLAYLRSYLPDSQRCSLDLTTPMSAIGTVRQRCNTARRPGKYPGSLCRFQTNLPFSRPGIPELPVWGINLYKRRERIRVYTSKKDDNCYVYKIMKREILKILTPPARSPLKGIPLTNRWRAASS